MAFLRSLCAQWSGRLGSDFAIRGIQAYVLVFLRAKPANLRAKPARGDS